MSQRAVSKMFQHAWNQEGGARPYFGLDVSRLPYALIASGTVVSEDVAKIKARWWPFLFGARQVTPHCEVGTRQTIVE